MDSSDLITVTPPGNTSSPRLGLTGRHSEGKHQGDCNAKSFKTSLPHPSPNPDSKRALRGGPVCRLQDRPRPGTFAPRTGDEIVAAGQFVHTGTHVVLWMDPGGYDAYRVERRFSPLDKADWETSQAEVRGLGSPNRYNLRSSGLSSNEVEHVRGGGWDLPLLQRVVDQFVIHFDVCGTSRQCFKVSTTCVTSACISCSTWTARFTRPST